MFRERMFRGFYSGKRRSFEISYSTFLSNWIQKLNVLNLEWLNMPKQLGMRSTFCWWPENPESISISYFGLPIKFIAIVFIFLDLLFNILPVIFAPHKYRIVFIVVALCTRIAAFYTVFAPILKYLNAYRVVLVSQIWVKFNSNLNFS